MVLTSLVLALALVLNGCGATDGPESRSGSVAHPLAGEIPGIMERAGIPGLSIAVVEDGEIAWTGAFGVADARSGEPVTEETVFEAASLSKPVFAYAVLRLAERGELDLDRSLWELLEYERFGGVERARALTPRLVLSHQTGLPNWGGEVLEFGFEPGSRFGYSGEGYLYLQRTLEAQTGLTLDELVAREVFEPLGMEDSRFTWPEDEVFALAIGHDQAGEASVRNIPEPNAAGSLHTTARDYAAFMVALLEGRGLAPSTLDEAFAPAVRMRGDERGDEIAPEIAGQVGWGLGWGVQEAGGERIVWHWGDNGTFRAFVAMRPGTRSGAVYFANSSNGLAVAREIVESVVGDMAPTFAWLGYDQMSDPGWSERREGFLAENAGELRTAIAWFERALEARPGDEVTARRVEWLRELIEIRESPVSVPEERLRGYVGSYGPRNLRLEGSELVYQRDGRDPYRLHALSEDTFALDGMVDFRIQVVTDDGGHPTALRGLYVNGDTDESPRDSG